MVEYAVSVQDRKPQEMQKPCSWIYTSWHKKTLTLPCRILQLIQSHLFGGMNKALLIGVVFKISIGPPSIKQAYTTQQTNIDQYLFQNQTTEIFTYSPN